MEWGVDNTFKRLKDMEPTAVMDVATIPNIDSGDAELSPEKGTAVPATKLPATKPRKKTMTSVYLKFFETAPDRKSRRCKFCGQAYSIATATGNLGRHLSSRHPGYDKSGDAVTSTALQTSTTVVRKCPPETKTPKVELDHLNWLLIKWLASSSLPPAILEDKWLINSFRYLNPNIQIWSAQKFQAVLRDVFKSMQDNMKATLEQVASKMSIALEFWTSYQQLRYMNITCQWIDDNWSFQKHLLDICHIPYPHGGAEIYYALMKVLKMYNIDDKVLACTHDNSQGAMHACHSLKEERDAHTRGLFCFIPCAARALNMIIDEGLRTTKALIYRVREFVIELNASSEISDEFVQLATAYQEGSWKIPLDASARWSGNYQMLDVVRKASKSMDAVIRKHDETLGSRLLLNAAEKNAINAMHGYLEPLYKTTNNICANKFPTVGLVLFFMDHISETISAYKDSRQYPEWLKNDAEEMSKKARSYNSQVCSAFTYMTAVLDPRIKAELIPESLNREKNLEEARSHFLTNYSNNHFPSMTSIYGVQDNECGSVSFAEEIARKKRRASMNSATDELTQYLSEPPAPMPTNVLEWWKANSTRYPRLSIMARDFLSVQATSMEPEELFCSRGDEIEKQRHSISSDSVQAILCIKSWNEGGLKLKYGSTEIDYDMLMELATNVAADSDKKQKS